MRTRAKPQAKTQDTKLALIYGRVSSKKQVSAGDGLNSQLTACLNYAETKGYEVVATFTDDLTGSALRRPGLDALLAVMQSDPSRRYRIIFDHINRFSRDIYLHGDLRRLVDDMGGILESPSMVYGNDSSSRLVENMSVVVSDYQRVHNKEQTNIRMRSRLENGYAVFCAPAGYRYGRVAGHGGRVLIPDPVVAPVMVEALEAYACGRLETAADVQRFLEAHPLFPKSRQGKVPHGRVGALLRNPAFAGLVGSTDWGIPFRKGHHKALISVETHQRVLDRLNGVNRVPSRKFLNQDFPLRGFVMCADCNEPLTACWSSGTHARYAYYLCPRRGCASYGKSIRREAIEGEFETLLETAQPNERVFALATAMFKELWRRRHDNAAAVVRSLKDEVKRIEQAIDGTVERLVESTVPAVQRALEKKVAALEGEKLLATEKLARSGRIDGTYGTRLRTALAFLSNPCGVWKKGDFEDRRAVLKLTFADRLRYKRGEGFRTANMTLPFKVLADFATGENGMAHPTRFERVTFAFGGLSLRVSASLLQFPCDC